MVGGFLLSVEYEKIMCDMCGLVLGLRSPLGGFRSTGIVELTLPWLMDL
jgi:hypothetical protein